MEVVGAGRKHLVVPNSACNSIHTRTKRLKAYHFDLTLQTDEVIPPLGIERRHNERVVDCLTHGKRLCNDTVQPLAADVPGLAVDRVCLSGAGEVNGPGQTYANSLPPIRNRYTCRFEHSH